MSIVKYKNDLLSIIFNSNDSFSDNCHNIGLKIYKLGGSKALFLISDLLSNELMSNEYSSEYLEALRILEFSWNNICDEWQA